MKFSVIIPVYNKADTIRSSVDSVLAQTVTDYELIVVDDGSTDATPQVLAEYGDRVTVIRQQNGGVSAARNTGIDAAGGVYVCFLDGDDLWEPYHLQTLCAMMERYPDCCCFLTSHLVKTPDGATQNTGDHLRSYACPLLCEDLLGLINATSHSLVHTNSICIRRDTLNAQSIRFVPGEKVGEDTDVWYRVALYHPVAVSDVPTTVYRREFSSATQSSFHTFDWVFARRAATLLADPAISAPVKASLQELLDRYHLTSSREYVLQGNRKEAGNVLKTVYKRSGKRYWLTRIFTLLPTGICRYVYGKR